MAYFFKKDFPLLMQNNIAYLDSAATTQKPMQVINAISEYYKNSNANPHRGAYKLSLEATKVYNEARKKVAKFINAKSEKQIVFTRNATESLNLIAYSYGLNNLCSKDKIVLSIMEHHSNLVPWQYVSKKTGAKIEYMYINNAGEITDEEIDSKIVEGTKIVGITHVSNVLGTINPIGKIIKKAHSVGSIVVVDASQSVPHMKVDVQKLDADFLVFSGHKMLAPLGIGVLYAKSELLEKMKPFLFGGDMIEYVYEQNATFAEVPTKYEAGTQNVEGAVGLSSAIDYLNNLELANYERNSEINDINKVKNSKVLKGMEVVQAIEKELTMYALEELQKLAFVTIYGLGGTENLANLGASNDAIYKSDNVKSMKVKNIEERQAGVISFNVSGVHPHDVASVLDSENVCIRSGNHCAQPLLRYMGLESTCRVSFYIYNTKEDVDRLIDALYKTKKLFAKWIR